LVFSFSERNYKKLALFTKLSSSKGKECFSPMFGGEKKNESKQAVHLSSPTALEHAFVAVIPRTRASWQLKLV